MKNNNKEGKLLIINFLNDEMLIGMMCGCCISFIGDETVPLWLKIFLGVSVLFGPIITQLTYCTALLEYHNKKKANDLSMLSVLNFLVFLFPIAFFKKEGIALIVCIIILLPLMLYFNYLNIFEKKTNNDKQ